MTLNPVQDFETVAQVWRDVATETQKSLEARWEQGIAAGERISRGFYAEHEEARKAWESLVKIAASSGETLGSLAARPFGFAPFAAEAAGPERQALTDLLFQQNIALYRTWAGYLIGVQQRQTALARDLSQAALRSAEALTPAYRSLTKAGEELLGLAQRSVRDVASFPENGASSPSKKKAAAA